MAQIIKTVFQIRRDYEANWLINKDVIPKEGEPCFVIDKNILKIGDGTTTFENLPSIGGVSVDADGTSLVFEDGVLKMAGFDAAEVGAQPRKNAEGKIEWVVPSTETVEGLQASVAGLQSDVKAIQEIVTPKEGDTLLSRVEGLEGKVEVLNGDETIEGSVLKIVKDEINAFATKVSDDGTVNTIKEFIDYVAEHGPEAAEMAADITELKGLVGGKSVEEQIATAGHIAEDKAKAIFEQKKFEISDTPVGTLVDYTDREIRVMAPANTVWTKQAVGVGGDANTHYMTLKTYAPNDKVVGYREYISGKGDEEVLTDLKTDVYGRKYQPTWLGLAVYDEASDTWNYYGKASSKDRMIGWDYRIDWYDADGVVIASDSVRISLANEDCYHSIAPYYMGSVVKGIKMGGTLLEMVEGIVEIKTSEEVVVNEDGSLGIGKISFDKIVQGEDTEIIMDGGASA